MKKTKQLLRSRIKELRKMRALSQEKLADIVDLDPKYVSFIECGRNAPSLETMENIAQALEVEIKDLFEFAHLQAGGIKAEKIEKLLEGADEEKKRTIMKIIRAVVR